MINERELEKRGFIVSEYEKALAENDEDGITLNHPTNFMTEGEVEEVFGEKD